MVATRTYMIRSMFFGTGSSLSWLGPVSPRASGARLTALAFRPSTGAARHRAAASTCRLSESAYLALSCGGDLSKGPCCALLRMRPVFCCFLLL
uniref:Secreted protein n=1 Tax=Macrostomum lignano TaxID=282301 RepID=A0A1I8FCD4_9PLAT